MGRYRKFNFDTKLYSVVDVPDTRVSIRRPRRVHIVESSSHADDVDFDCQLHCARSISYRSGVAIDK